MRPIYAIFRNTFLETIRQPIYALLLSGMCLLIALTPAMAAHIYTFGAGTGLERAADRMIADLGLATVLLTGLLLSIFSASNVIVREIEEETALTVLSKPIGRASFVVGKYLGIATAIALASGAGVVTVLLTIRTRPTVTAAESMDPRVLAAMIGAAVGAMVIATLRNYYQGRPWIGTFTFSFLLLLAIVFFVFLPFDTEYHWILPLAPTDETTTDRGTAYDWQVAIAGILTIEAVLILTGVSIAAGTRLHVSGTFAVAMAIFLAGLVSEYGFKHYGDGVAAEILRILIPNLQIFWMSEALTRERDIPLMYLGIASGYASCYIIAMLFLAAFLFEKREIA